MRGLMLLALASASMPLNVFALDFPLPNSENILMIDQQRQDFSDYNFEGIISLSNCSGSLVRFDDSTDNDRAMVLSNGHCVRLLRPGSAIIDRPSLKRITFLTPSGEKIGSTVTRKIIYATMTDTDLSLYQLGMTFNEIRTRFSVEPLTLSRQTVQIGDAIEIISGYWRRGYSCDVENIVFNLIEGDWLFKNAIRYSRPGCEVIGGTSGSPAVLAGTRTVIGVNNTMNERGLRCEINNPCEVDEDGEVFFEKGIGYAQQVAAIYTCRNDDNNIDLNKPGCTLPR